MPIVPHQHQQAALIPQSVFSVPQQHPQAATVSDEMSLFNNLDSDAKVSRVYEFMLTHMRGLETRLNEIARNTSERFSQVDARLQALEQRAVEQTVRPHESTAQIVVSGLPTRGQLSYEDIVTRIFNSIEATRFLVDVNRSSIVLKRMRALVLLMAAPRFLRRSRSYCGSILCKFATRLRLKILKGNISVVTMFPNLPAFAENKVFLNEFLAKEVHKLL